MDGVRVGGESLTQRLRHPGTSYSNLTGADRALPQEVIEQIEIETKYQGYISRELALIDRLRRSPGRAIPPDTDYWQIPSLRYEAREKLSRVRPAERDDQTRPSMLHLRCFILDSAVQGLLLSQVTSDQ
jgi:tRNA uridine 5-carboxymethylaminomethyl modification enzyme